MNGSFNRPDIVSTSWNFPVLIDFIDYFKGYNNAGSYNVKKSIPNVKSNS